MATISIRLRDLKRWQALPRFTYPLAALTILGLGAGLLRLYGGLGDTTNLNTVFPWGLWISFDLATVAFSGAAFTLAALVYIFHIHELHSAMRPTVLFGLLGYGSVLVVLFFDLGRWDRFWHFIVYPNLTSALFEVSWCILIYTSILFYEFSPVILERFKNPKLLSLIRKITIPVVIAGITLSSMHQSSLGSLFVILSPRLHPLWYSVLQPVFFLTSSLSAGLAAIIIGSYASMKMYGQTLSLKVIERLGCLLPWFLGLYLALKLGELLFTGEFGLLFSSGVYSLLYMVEMLAIVIPIVLFSRKRIRTSRKSSLLSALVVAGGILLNRFSTSWFALSQLHGMQYFPSWIEVGLLVGIISGVLLLFTLASHYLPVFAETDAAHTAG